MEWKTGKFPSACESCQHAEESNGTSRRTGSNQWYQDHGYYNDTVELIRLDYWTGDLCNLACAICGPHNSSSWKQELNLPVTLKKVVVNTTWKSLDLSALQFVHFNGGEPLLSKEHVDFLQNIPNKNQVHLNYNTNGTILPSTELLALWKKFKLVQLDFSIDDVGEQFEFQRYPAEWNDVSFKLQWFIDNCPGNCMFAVNTTVSVLNYNNLDKLINWVKQNFYRSKFTDPIEHRYQSATGILSVNNINKQPGKIIEYLDSLDQRRGTKWKHLFPELASILTNP